MGDAERSLPTVVFSSSKRWSKFKHAAVFGVAGPYSRAGAAAFESALWRRIQAETTRVAEGTFRGRIPVTMYVDAATALMVVTRRNGQFVSAWRVSPEQVYFVLEHDTL